MKYNQKLIDTITERFEEVVSKLNTPNYLDKHDLYSLIASILYNKPYESCLETTTAGKELRMNAKHFLLQVVIDCGGYLSEDYEKDEI